MSEAASLNYTSLLQLSSGDNNCASDCRPTYVSLANVDKAVVNNEVSVSSLVNETQSDLGLSSPVTESSQRNALVDNSQDYLQV